MSALISNSKNSSNLGVRAPQNDDGSVSKSTRSAPQRVNSEKKTSAQKRAARKKKAEAKKAKKIAAGAQVRCAATNDALLNGMFVHIQETKALHGKLSGAFVRGVYNNLQEHISANGGKLSPIIEEIMMWMAQNEYSPPVDNE